MRPDNGRGYSGYSYRERIKGEEGERVMEFVSPKEAREYRYGEDESSFDTLTDDEKSQMEVKEIANQASLIEWGRALTHHHWQYLQQQQEGIADETKIQKIAQQYQLLRQVCTEDSEFYQKASSATIEKTTALLQKLQDFLKQKNLEQAQFREFLDGKKELLILIRETLNH